MKTCKGNEKCKFAAVRLDPVTAGKLEYLCSSFGVSTSTMLRWLISYIDDHREPCGRLAAFRDHRKRMDEMARKYGWI